MPNYLLDTNILVLLLRKDPRWMQIHNLYGFEHSNNFISVVSIGELYSLGLQNNWGENRLSQIEILREEFVVADINIGNLIQRYAEIDTFSQGKLKTKTLDGSARNMGKNDLWIAATASSFDLSLVTTDKDFSHLANDFLDLQWVDLTVI